MEFNSDIFEFPLPDEVKRVIGEILEDPIAKEEIRRIGILKFLQKRGGEFKIPEEFSSKFEIRRGIEADSKALGELADALEDEGFTGPSSVQALRGGQKWIRGFIKDDRVHNKDYPRKWLFFAFDGDRLVGNVNGFDYNWGSPMTENEKLRVRYHLPDKRYGFVGIHVHPDYREKGVGEALMQRAIQEAKQLGVEVLTMLTWTRSKPMIRLAEKMGFKEHMQLKKGDEVGYRRVLKEPMVFMTLEIQ